MKKILTLNRGTNISHWLSQSEKRGIERKEYFKETDIKIIKDLGFDHIRLPFDEEQLWDINGKLDSEACNLLEDALTWCDRAKLKVVLDFHILRTHYFNDKNVPLLFTKPSETERFINLWLEFSERFKKVPETLAAYEILNEPVAPLNEDWNRIAIQVFNAIRKAEPERTILLGSNRFNSVETFLDLEVPQDDLCILTFHFYHPMFITHYKAKWWDGGVYEGPISYPGRPIPEENWNSLDIDFRKRFEKENEPFDPDKIRLLLEKPLKVREKTKCPLYCGEFGCYHSVPSDISIKWYSDVLEVFNKNSIGWANWDYKGGFGIINKEGVRSPIIKVMMNYI